MMATLAAARDSGAMTQEYVDAYLEELADTHGDVFLDFLTNELHPRLYSSELRVSESGHGLFGYSYGGLFALYAWLRDAPPFATFGAGSPGVVNADSQIDRRRRRPSRTGDLRLRLVQNAQASSSANGNRAWLPWHRAGWASVHPRSTES